MLRLVVPVVLLVVAAAAMVVTDRPLPAADFTFVSRADVATLDYQRMSWMQDLRLANVIGEGLTANDVFTWDYRVVPAAAESWAVSADGLTYTFRIREGAKWSNGERLRAGDFVYSWRRALLPETAADYTGFVQLIRGGRAFFLWRQGATAEFAAGKSGAKDAGELWELTLKKFGEMVGLRAEDDRTLVVELERPVPYFLDLCAFPAFFPVYPPLVSRYERVDPATGMVESRRDWTKPPLLVTNGPFRLASWRFKRDMRFEKNEHYWNAGEIAIDSMNMPSIADQNAQVLAFQTGAVDWTSDVGAAYRADMLADKMRFYAEHRAEYERLKAEGWDQFEIDRRLPDDPRKNIHAIPTFGTYFYNFNCRERLADGRPNPFADARVRRAFAMAIDRGSLVKDVLRIGNPEATTLIPRDSIAGYTSPRGVGFDPEGARRLLAEAGYPSGRAFPVTVEILFNKEGEHDKIAQLVAKNWSQVLGVEVVLAQKELKVFRDDLKKGNFIVTRAAWYGDYGDPTTFLDINRSWDGNNDRKYASEEYDAILERAAAERDPGARMRLLEEAERKIMDEDLPLTPLYQYVTLYLFDPDKVSGINGHPRTDQKLMWIDILGDGKGRDRARMMPKRGSGSTEQQSSGAAGPQGHRATWPQGRRGAEQQNTAEQQSSRAVSRCVVARLSAEAAFPSGASANVTSAPSAALLFCCSVVLFRGLPCSA